MSGKEDKNGVERGEDTEEDEVFKTLGHATRRRIIKAVGSNGSLSFSEILKSIGDIDSPSLSYHLKSLSVLLFQKAGKYKLTKIGNSAYNLLEKTDQTGRLKKGKRRFVYAMLVTLICWLVAGFFVPIIYDFVSGEMLITGYIVLINVVSTINIVILGILKDKF